MFIIAHPDDETMFNLGRFKERGWDISVALVTNGENGGVVQSIRHDYDPKSDDDILIEKDPSPGAWLTTPPDGPALKEITMHRDLAIQRRREFISSQTRHGVSTIFFLSDIDSSDFEDNWNNGVKNWDQSLLVFRLEKAVKRIKPDIIITLNPDETWAHRQHFGLARIVKKMWEDGCFDIPEMPRPILYGIREHGWYERSWEPQTGDCRFDRTEYSTVLGMTYEQYWREATSFYISQSSNPVWFAARVTANILPGYRSMDIIRRLDSLSDRQGLDELFSSHRPDLAMMNKLPLAPEIVNLAGK